MDVFLSYVWSDREVAQRLTNDLLRRGFAVWPEHEDSALPTENFFQELTDLIASSKVFLVLVSAAANQDQFAANELAVALAAVQANPAMALIPVLVEPGAEVLPPLDQYTTINFSAAEQYEIQLARLLALMKENFGVGPSNPTIQRSGVDLLALSFLVTLVVGTVVLRTFAELPAWTLPYLVGVATGAVGGLMCRWLLRRREAQGAS